MIRVQNSIFASQIDRIIYKLQNKEFFANKQNNFNTLELQ